MEVELWDTAGQEDFDRLRPLTYPETDAVIACFSITNPDSYQNVIEKWIPEVKYFLPKTPIILAGTKRDLRNDQKTIEKLKSRNLKPLTFQDGCLLANQVGAYGYCECSSRLNEGVYQVFSMAIESSSKYKKKTLNETNKFCLIS